MRSSPGTLSAALICTTPTTSSSESRQTGNREKPVAALSCATSCAFAPRPTAWTSTRGVITFSAFSSRRCSARTKCSAVSRSIVPSRAECRASATSSSGVRAEASSSVGESPSARTTRFAARFRWLITTANTAANTRSGPVTILATPSGSVIARFFGTSSPATISTPVESSSPITSAAL